MKYAVMSFSFPDMGPKEIIGQIKKYGYTGFEPRLDSGHKHGIELNVEEADLIAIKKQFDDADIDISCIAVGCKYVDPDTNRENIEKTKKYIELANIMGAPNLRVFGGDITKISRDEATDLLIKSLKELAPYAEKAGVTICIETHDAWSNPHYVAQVLKEVNSPFVAANWDVMHPVLWESVSIRDSFEALKPWIKYVHFHDGFAVDGNHIKFVPNGTGAIDHKKAVELLMSINFKGYLSLEWETPDGRDEYLPFEINKMKEYEK